MKIKRSLFFILLMFSSMFIHAQQLIVGTYNIRYDNPRDSGNLWVDRAPAVAGLIRFHGFDILGTQEGLRNQLDDISNALPYFSRYGVGRTDGKEKGEHSAIYYRTDKFTLLNKGNFWLSQTPEKPSRGWDAVCCNRICSWVQLQDKESEKSFYFFNAHFDHEGVVARRESSRLMLQKIGEIAGPEPVILTGDLNGDHYSESYRVLDTSGVLRDTYRQVEYPYANNASFNGFRARPDSTGIIDHVFTSSHFAVDKWGLLTDTYYGKFPSDHFPVLAVIKFQ